MLLGIVPDRQALPCRQVGEEGCRQQQQPPLPITVFGSRWSWFHPTFLSKMHTGVSLGSGELRIVWPGAISPSQHRIPGWASRIMMSTAGRISEGSQARYAPVNGNGPSSSSG